MRMKVPISIITCLCLKSMRCTSQLEQTTCAMLNVDTLAGKLRSPCLNSIVLQKWASSTRLKLMLRSPQCGLVGKRDRPSVRFPVDGTRAWRLVAGRPHKGVRVVPAYLVVVVLWLYLRFLH